MDRLQPPQIASPTTGLLFGKGPHSPATPAPGSSPSLSAPSTSPACPSVFFPPSPETARRIHNSTHDVSTLLPNSSSSSSNTGRGGNEMGEQEDVEDRELLGLVQHPMKHCAMHGRMAAPTLSGPSFASTMFRSTHESFSFPQQQQQQQQQQRNANSSLSNNGGGSSSFAPQAWPSARYRPQSQPRRSAKRSADEHMDTSTESLSSLRHSNTGLATPMSTMSTMSSSTSHGKAAWPLARVTSRRCRVSNHTSLHGSDGDDDDDDAGGAGDGLSRGFGERPCKMRPRYTPNRQHIYGTRKEQLPS